MSHTIAVPGTRCTIKLVQPQYTRKDKTHHDADGRPKDCDALMLDHIADITAKLAGCTGKHKRKALVGGVSRKYPRQGECMDTASYVRRFYALNGLMPTFFKSKVTKELLDAALSRFEPLSTRTQEWPEEPLFETIDDNV